MGVKYNYNQKSTEKRRKRLILIIIIIIIILLTLACWRKFINMKNSSEDKVYLETSDFTSAKEILEYYGNKYYKEEKLKNSTYSFIIYTSFKYDLYTDNESNEKFFNQMVNLIAEVTEYKDFILVDESKNIKIKVVCKEQEIKIININGDNNYFETMDTRKALENKENQKYTELNIQSNIINNLINNKWIAKNVEFGIKESTYDKYDIYFDEGIEVRIISGKVFNIVFNNKYKENIVNGITTTYTKEEITDILGSPTFEDSSLNLYGYKGNEIYIFFGDEQISIYRVEDEFDTTEFIKLIEEYNSTKDLKELGNELTYLWSDYDEYNYDTNFMEITYSLKGVKIQFNINNKNGFILYNNYKGLVTEEKYFNEINGKNELLRNMYIEDNDLIFLNECKRKNKEYFKYNREGDFANHTKINNMFNMLYDSNLDGTLTNIKFVSLNKEYPNSELDDKLTIDSYLWQDDYMLIYSIKNKGIYKYNCETRKTENIISGEDEFNLKEIEDGILKYDNKEIEIN